MVAVPPLCSPSCRALLQRGRCLPTVLAACLSNGGRRCNRSLALEGCEAQGTARRESLPAAEGDASEKLFEAQESIFRCLLQGRRALRPTLGQVAEAISTAVCRKELIERLTLGIAYLFRNLVLVYLS